MSADIFMCAGIGLIVALGAVNLLFASREECSSRSFYLYLAVAVFEWTCAGLIVGGLIFKP